MKKDLPVIIIALFLSFAVNNQAKAEDLNQCSKANQAGDNSVDTYYDPRIQQVRSSIEDIKKAGGDPNGVAIKVGDKFFTLPEIESKLEFEKKVSYAVVTKDVADCNSQLKPYQDIMDGYIAFQTGGLSKILPGKMGFVDVSDILAGYPLGGSDALIPKARDDILKSLGIGGTAATIIRDPIQQGIIRPVACIFGCPR